MKTVLLLVIAALFMGAASVYAVDSAPGGAELELLEKIFTGNIGLTIGLFVAITGIITFVQGNTSGGIMLIVLGVLLTLLPGIFNGIRNISCPIAEALGARCGGTTS